MRRCAAAVLCSLGLGACQQAEAPALAKRGAAAEPIVERAASGQLVYARAARAWVLAEPRVGAERLGYLRAGAAVAGRPGPGPGSGCAGGWAELNPKGFVCLGTSATLDSADAVVQAVQGSRPDFARKLPYIYGTVRKPGPVYRRLPNEDELRAAEPDLEARMNTWLTAPGETGAAYAQDVWLAAPGVAPDPAVLWSERRTEDIPEFLTNRGALPRLGETIDGGGALGAEMRPRAGYSFVKTFVWQGRRYGLTTELELAPTDRFRPIRGSDFHGVELGKDIDFPFAFVRSPTARFVRLDGKRPPVDAGPAPYRAAIRLTGKQRFARGRLHFETADGTWLSDDQASRLDPAKRMPGWGKKGERWLDVNLSKQTLVAYEGVRPVYATLISSGEAGLEDPEHTTATKRGIFRIHTKHVSATMSSDEVGEEFELRDVPYVQYFEDGYALHGAYWHDRFGTPKSHGCINLAPEDARRLFSFTEPGLPAGWHGVLTPLRGSVVFVHP
jgi:hypothetical protein